MINFDTFFFKILEELQKFVEDNQWKRSLHLEPNQLKAPDDSEDKTLMGNLNLSPSKHPNIPPNQATRPFVPGHRRAKSDGCGMFFSSYNKRQVDLEEKYKSNYR